MAYYRKRGDKWSFTVDVGVDPITGKRKQKTLGGFDSEKAAELACSQIIVDVSRGDYVDSKETLRAFMEDFLVNHVKHNVAESTYTMSKVFANKHIYPYFGNIKIAKITAIHIQKFYSFKINEGLSAGHIANIGILLGKAFKAAHQWGLINKNVVSLVKKPSVRSDKMQVWTQEQVNYFLKETSGTRFHVVYLLALTTGMRIGEILALDWPSIDFAGATISVNKTVVHTNKHIFVKEPKTASGRRLITIPQSVVSYLKKYKISTPINEKGIIVPGIKGIYCYNSTVSQVFHKEAKRLNLPELRFHDLRHTHATLLLMMGENPKVVQERLGHAKISITLDTYSHVLPSMQKGVADKLNEAFQWG